MRRIVLFLFHRFFANIVCVSFLKLLFGIYKMCNLVQI